MSIEPSQKHIWSHFQNRAVNVFQDSHPRLDFIIRRIQGLTRLPSPVVLNIGIGDGHLEKMAHSRGWPIRSLDPDPEAVQKLCELGISAKAGVIEAIPFPDADFDFVVASEVLEHLTQAQRQQGLAEIKRTLKSGGHFIGTVPYRELLELNVAVCPNCRHVFHRWGHAATFDLAKMREELAPHFGVISCRRTAFVEFSKRSLTGKLKSIARLVLAKCGAAIAIPSIFFVARKP